MNEPELYPAVNCGFVLLESGAVVLYPQTLLAGLQRFVRGRSSVKWDQFEGASGSVYSALLVDLESEGTTLRVALVPPKEARPFLETGRALEAHLAISEPVGDFGVETTNLITFNVPPFPGTTN